ASLPLAPGPPDAAVQLDETPYDRQTEARAAMTATHRRLDLIEGIPDACQLLLRDPDAVVLHRHPHLIALAAGQHAHLAAGRAEFHRVADEVDEDLLQSGGIGLHGGRSGGNNVRTWMRRASAAAVTTVPTCSTT